MTVRSSSPFGVALVIASCAAACVQRSGAPASAGTQESAAAPAAEGASTSPAAAAPSGGTSVLGEGGVAAFQPAGATAKVELRQIDVQGQPFDKALEVVVK